MSKSLSSRAVFIFFLLFGGIFAVAGIAAGVTAIPPALESDNREARALARAIIGALE